MRRHLLAPVVLHASLALAALCALAAPAPAEQLPEGVLARVHGRQITEDAVYDRLATKHERGANGKQVLALLVEDVLVRQEAARRGVTVSDAETETYLAKVDRKIQYDSGGTKSLESVFQEQGSTREEFAATARQFLFRQKMAQKDLGWRPPKRDPAGRGVHLDDVPKHRVALWLSSLKARHPVVMTGLPPGMLAKVGEQFVGRQEFARALAEKLPPETIRVVLGELVLEAAAAHDLREAGIVTSDADVNAEIARQEARFAARPEVRGTGMTYDQFLQQMRGHGVEALRADPGFRAALGLRRLLLANITVDALRTHWNKNRLAYGERAMIRTVYIPAGRSDANLQLPSWKDAYDLALRAKVRILNGAGVGMTPGAGAKPVPLDEMVTRVAKQFAGGARGAQTAGEPTVWTRAAVVGEEDLEKVVFTEKTGELRGPVRTRLGYHVLLVDERRPAPAFESIQEDIREDVLRKEMRRYRLRVLTDENVVLGE